MLATVILLPPSLKLVPIGKLAINDPTGVTGEANEAEVLSSVFKLPPIVKLEVPEKFRFRLAFPVVFRLLPLCETNEALPEKVNPIPGLT